MIEKIENSWKLILQDECIKPYFNELTQQVEEHYLKAEPLVFPPREQCFRAFELCTVSALKVVILGQDPYPTKGHANGLCFSVDQTVRPLAKSLVNIFKELQQDLSIAIPENGDLTRWANQGVLLLNSILTVDEGAPQSHKGIGWEKFTDAVIQKISEEKSGVVFILWGGYAIKKGKKIDRTKHLVLESGHPSPLSANQGKWFGNKHFSQTNAYLLSQNKEPIRW